MVDMPVTQPCTCGHLLEKYNPGLPFQDRPEIVDLRIQHRMRRLEAIDGDPGTGCVKMGIRKIKDSRAVREVIDPDAVFPGLLHDFLENPDLLQGKGLVSFIGLGENGS